MSRLEIANFIRYRYDDYKNWSGDWELIDGFPIAMSPSPMIDHQFVCKKIIVNLEKSFEKCEECEVYHELDWIIDDENVVRPDILVVCNNVDTKFITKTPKMIFEVLSKSTSHVDRVVKFDIYEKEGVKYYTIIDTDKKIAKVYFLKDGKFIKLQDVTDEKIKFNLDDCEFEFDFSLIWKKK